MGNDHVHEAGSEQSDPDHQHAPGGLFGANTELIFALLSGAFLAVGFLISIVTAAPDLDASPSRSTAGVSERSNNLGVRPERAQRLP